jgi:hypothetical protein
MRIVLGGLLVGLAMTLVVNTVKAAELKRPLPNEPVLEQPVADAAPEARQTLSVGGFIAQEETKNFHEGAFVYIAPPTPQPPSSMFHGGTYKFVASDGSRKGRLIADEMYGLVPASTQVARKASTTVAAAATPSAPAASPTAPATATATAVPATAAIQPIRAVKPDAALDDPRFYRGSFTYDAQLNKLLPIEQKPCCIAAAGGLAGVRATPEAQSASLTKPQSGEQAKASVLPVQGKAMYYNPGIMDQVLEYRLALGQVTPCPECVGYVALLRSDDLNRKVWIEWGQDDVEGPFLVIDVAARQHVPMLLARQWVVDVDYATALRRSMVGPVFVRVLDAPPRFSPMRPVDFSLTANAKRYGD